MSMNSCLYECLVVHQRLLPQRYALRHAIFMLYVDLDELERAHDRFRLLSYNGWNLYSFRDDDHIPTDRCAGAPLAERLRAYLETQGVHLAGDCRIMLLTLPRVLGYVFNPISIYFCLDRHTAAPRCAVAEVGNTFGEHKLYLLRPEQLRGEQFELRIPKHYYVSPFSSLTLEFDFRLRVPSEALDIRIDDYEDARKTLRSSLVGRRRPLSDSRLLWYALKYPLLTLKVIGLIHWHATRLWLKGLPWHRKADNPQWQRQILRPEGSSHPQEPAALEEP
jgi:DUF1365 family protein